jgi:hypothetical protein
MIDKLEDIKGTYETELEYREKVLNDSKSLAVKQLKNIRNQMRQDQINSQREILKLQDIKKIKL